MKDTFRGYYPPSDDELEKIWSEGLIVLDANALLNVLRYSASTRDQLMELLEKEKDRVWIPHQVGLEFQRNRRKMPGELAKAFASVEAELTSARNTIDQQLRNLGRHAHIEADELAAQLVKYSEKLSKKLRRARTKHLKAVTSDQAHQETFSAISELYQGRVGPAYDEAALKAIYKEGEGRYAKRYPPGYADAKEKTGDDKYGDLVVWKQILDHVSGIKLPMLFITDDNKEDWWEKTGGKTHGPRPELIEEYYAASSERTHFYNLRRFLAFAKERGEDISDESVEEAGKVSTVPRFKFNTSQDVAVRRMFERVNQVLLNSTEYDEMMAKGRRILEEFDFDGLVPRKPRLEEFAREMTELGISHPVRAQTLEAQEHMRREARRQAVLKRIVNDLDGDQGKINFNFNDEGGVFDDDGVA